MKIYGFSNVATSILILFELSPNFYIVFYGVPLFTCRDLLFNGKQLKLAVYSEKLGSFPSEICIYVMVTCIK